MEKTYTKKAKQRRMMQSHAPLVDATCITRPMHNKFRHSIRVEDLPSSSSRNQEQEPLPSSSHANKTLLQKWQIKMDNGLSWTNNFTVTECQGGAALLVTCKCNQYAPRNPTTDEKFTSAMRHATETCSLRCNISSELKPFKRKRTSDEISFGKQEVIAQQEPEAVRALAKENDAANAKKIKEKYFHSIQTSECSHI